MPRSIAYSSDAEERARSIVQSTPQGSPERRGEDEIHLPQEPVRAEPAPSLKVTVRVATNYTVRLIVSAADIDQSSCESGSTSVLSGTTKGFA
jgi:hypothetical protein